MKADAHIPEIPRPDPVPRCAWEWCERPVTGEKEGTPYCAFHGFDGGSRWRPYAEPDLDDQRAADVLRLLPSMSQPLDFVGAALRRRYQEGQAEERERGAQACAKARATGRAEGMDLAALSLQLDRARAEGVAEGLLQALRVLLGKETP